MPNVSGVVEGLRDEGPEESITFVFGKLGWKYFPQNDPKDHVRKPMDSDDGLSDTWEQSGAIDANCDGCDGDGPPKPPRVGFFGPIDLTSWVSSQFDPFSLLQPTAPFLPKPSPRSKQSEAKANLKAMFTAEKAFFQEKDSYSDPPGTQRCLFCPR